jgi:uncharacterized integral membrane protein
MVRFLKLLLIAALAIVFLAFAFANRHLVTVSFDPFASSDAPAFAVETPLFVALIGAIMIGVVAGSAATWIAQGRHRRAARRWRAEAEAAKTQAPPPRG